MTAGVRLLSFTLKVHHVFVKEANPKYKFASFLHFFVYNKNDLLIHQLLKQFIMTINKEVKMIKTVISRQSSLQNKKVKDKKKNECGCGCLANQKM